MHEHNPILIAACLAACGATAAAQSDVSPTHKWSWGENIGFMNWRDAGDPDGAAGVQFHGAVGENAFLSGFVWCENTGWITVGDGSPVDGKSYANTIGSDTGINVDDSGVLSGLGWGENIGWVNFDTKAALGGSGQHARFDAAAGRFRGYAWGENVGWINLDNDEHFVALICPADFNSDGVVDTRDVLAFLNAWVSKQISADCDANGLIDTRDVLCFLNLWNEGC